MLKSLIVESIRCKAISKDHVHVTQICDCYGLVRVSVMDLLVKP